MPPFVFEDSLADPVGDGHSDGVAHLGLSRSVGARFCGASEGPNGIVQPSGKPWRRSLSVGVSRLNERRGLGPSVGVVAGVGSQGSADEGVSLGAVESDRTAGSAQGSDFDGDEGLPPGPVFAGVVSPCGEGGCDDLALGDFLCVGDAAVDRSEGVDDLSVIAAGVRSLPVSSGEGSHNVPCLGGVVVGSPGVGIEGVDDVCGVLLSSSRSRDARSARAVAKGAGNSRPRFAARLMIPAAAFGLKKNLGGTSASRTSGKDEDALTSLGHSEVSAIQHSPGEVVKPELGERREYDGEISSTVAGKKSGYVLNKEPTSGAENN